MFNILIEMNHSSRILCSFCLLKPEKENVKNMLKKARSKTKFVLKKG